MNAVNTLPVFSSPYYMNTACSIFGLIGVILDFLKLGYRTPTYERYKNGYDNSPEAIF